MSAEEAERCGQAALDWLEDELIVEDVAGHNLPDAGRRGQPPGQAWQSAIVEIDEYFLGLDINGVEVVAGRRYFGAGSYEVVPFCPSCNVRVTDPDTAASWRNARTRWVAGEDDVCLACPHCGATSPLVQWRHDPPVGFGHLGIRFWNWPSLNREFIDRLADVLGHRVVLVEGRVE